MSFEEFIKAMQRDYCLKEIYKYQADFDSDHGWFWSIKSNSDFIAHLQYLGIALAGEVGEFCNLIKKLLGITNQVARFQLKC